MDHPSIIHNLDSNKEVFRSLLINQSKTEYLWKSHADKWCLLEIVCHLYDEEREDFRTRIRHTLQSPNTLPPPIDPIGWVTGRNYMEQDYGQMVEKFLNERTASVNWLNSLSEPNWRSSCRHPELGTLSAEHFLANWLAHDLLHFRQIISVNYQFLQSNTHIDLSYAGKW